LFRDAVKGWLRFPGSILGPGLACAWGLCLLVRCMGLAAMLLPVATAQAPSGSLQLHMGFLSSSLGESNRNDVVAAMKVWLLTVAKERNLAANPLPYVYDSIGEMESALRNGDIDVFSASMEEFLLIEKRIPSAGMFASKVNGKLAEQYVVVVRRDRRLAGLKDLRGEDLVMMDHPRATLAPLWLDAELLRNNLPLSPRYFRKITLARKPLRAILPVFFKQAGAAIVTRASFETASELNPQLARELQVLVSSQDLIPGVGGYRKGATSTTVDFYRREALRLGESPAGKLVLNLFQIDSIVEINESDLGPTRSFLAEYARLKAEAGRRKATP
jgi:ABC-type phosphate/phosphonate transport system substrate-binding protein